MAALLIEARDAARDARAEGNKALDADIVAGLTSRYRSIAESGLAVNVYRGSRRRPRPVISILCAGRGRAASPAQPGWAA